jgi:hypothetical protein
MKYWMLLLVVAVLGMQVVGCKAKGEVDEADDDKASLKVDVDK